MICCIPWPCGVLCQLLEWIEDLEPRPFEVPVVPRGDREAVPACGRRDVAVLDRHALTRLVEQSFLLRPYVGDRHIEPVDASVQRVDEAREPGLQRLSLPAFFHPNPVRRLQDRQPTLPTCEATEDDGVLFGIEVCIEVVARLGWRERSRHRQASLGIKVTTVVGLS